MGGSPGGARSAEWTISRRSPRRRAERGADEMGRALTTLAERLERLEHDRRAVATRRDLRRDRRGPRSVQRSRSGSTRSPHRSRPRRRRRPTSQQLVDELAGSARSNGGRARVRRRSRRAGGYVDERARDTRGAGRPGPRDARRAERSRRQGRGREADVDPELLDNVDELAHRIEQIEARSRRRSCRARSNRDVVGDRARSAAGAGLGARGAHRHRPHARSPTPASSLRRVRADAAGARPPPDRRRGPSHAPRLPREDRVRSCRVEGRRAAPRRARRATRPAVRDRHGSAGPRPCRCPARITCQPVDRRSSRRPGSSADSTRPIDCATRAGRRCWSRWRRSPPGWTGGCSASRPAGVP